MTDNFTVTHQWHTVMSSDAPNRCPFDTGFHDKPKLQEERHSQSKIPSLQEKHHAPFLRLPYKPNIRLYRARPVGIAAMLRPVPHKHLPRHRARRDQVWVLRHISRAIDLARVVDALRDLYARLLREGVPPELAALVVVGRAVDAVGRGGCVALRELHGRDLEVVLRLA